MISAPVCRQAGWLNAECRMQIEKCKIAFCQIGTLARLHVRTLARWKWELEIGKWELEIGKWELEISVFRFLFSYLYFVGLTSIPLHLAISFPHYFTTH